MIDDTTPRRRPRPSGRFLLRIDPGLHALLRRDARAAGLSLNEFCARKLAHPGGPLPEPAHGALERAAAQFGESLVGVVAFGSWARGDFAQHSDVDLLVVLDPSVPLSRELYAPWDAAPLRWDAHPVEPHFVHRPDDETRLSGLWAEAAVDGVVLFERGLEVSRRLADVRRRIAEGRIVRRWAHGQPYWVEAA